MHSVLCAQYFVCTVYLCVQYIVCTVYYLHSLLCARCIASVIGGILKDAWLIRNYVLELL